MDEIAGRLVVGMGFSVDGERWTRSNPSQRSMDYVHWRICLSYV